MTDREYHPIDCSLHDRLEQIATLRSRVRIAYRASESDTVETEQQILDVFTRDGVELVRLGDGREIRLDDLAEVNGVSFQGGVIMRRLISTLLICVGIVGCNASEPPQSSDAAPDSMSRGARDSALARSRIPNAGAVDKAQGAAEAANQRTAAFDSIQQ